MSRDPYTLAHSHMSMDELQAGIEQLLAATRKEALAEAAATIIRRTEIPKDARNPTRDEVVILGEELARLILAAQSTEGEQG